MGFGTMYRNTMVKKKAFRDKAWVLGQRHFTSLLAPYPGEGSAVRIRRLQKFLSSASSGPPPAVPACPCPQDRAISLRVCLYGQRQEIIIVFFFLDKASVLGHEPIL